MWTKIFRHDQWKTTSLSGEHPSSTPISVVKTVGGQAEAVILKGRLEAENIPVHLSYDSVGTVYGFFSTHLGSVDIMVPKSFEIAARNICGTETDDGPTSPDPGKNEAT